MDALTKLKALEVPEEDRADHQKVIAAAERAAAASDEWIAALRAKDSDAAQRSLTERDRASNDLAAAVGVTDLAGCEQLWD